MGSHISSWLAIIIAVLLNPDLILKLEGNSRVFSVGKTLERSRRAAIDKKSIKSYNHNFLY